MSCLYDQNTIITVTTTNGVYTGYFLGIRHDHHQGEEGQFLYLRLTANASPYTAGEVIAINLIQVVAIGPVAAPA